MLLFFTLIYGCYLSLLSEVQSDVGQWWAGTYGGVEWELHEHVQSIE